MIKLVALVRRRADLTAGAFADHWLRVHAPLAAAIPGMRGYRINIAGDPGALLPAGFDGSAEIWFDNRAAMLAGLGSAAGAAAGEDVANFAEPVQFLVCDEHVILPRKAAP
jgi:uncharacterized protein (TIGR02118 family)